MVKSNQQYSEWSIHINAIVLNIPAQLINGESKPNNGADVIGLRPCLRQIPLRDFPICRLQDGIFVQQVLDLAILSATRPFLHLQARVFSVKQPLRLLA